MKRALALGVGLAVLLCGCASLQIDVDVYKGTSQVDRRSATRIAARTLVHPAINLSTRERARIADTYLQTLAGEIKEKRIAEVGLVPAKPFIDSVTRMFADESPGGFVQQNRALFEREVFVPLDDLGALAHSVHELSIRSGSTDAQVMGETAKLLELATRINSAAEEIAAESTRRYGPYLPQPADASWLRISAFRIAETILPDRSDLVSGVATQAPMAGRLVGYPIFDPSVSQLTQDPKNWAPFGRNRFSVNGGNSQFVVVREGTLVFHKKSLDFDPSSAISAAQASADLALNVAGAMATGRLVTTTKGANGQPDTNTETPLLDMAAAARSADTLDRDETARRTFLLRLADLIERVTPGQDLAPLKSEFNRLVQAYQASVSRP